MADSNTDDLVNRLLQNVHDVSQDPATSLNVRTFDEAELLFTRTMQKEQHLSVIQALVALLPSLQQDATPVVNLLLKLLESFTYSDVLNFGSQSLPFTDGLAVGERMVSYNRLVLTLLEKATHNPADAAQVASMLDTMLALVRLWLCTNDTGIASQASKLLLDLLKVDQQIQTDPDSHIPEGGQGFVWRRVFGDRNVYGTMFEACSLSGPSSITLSKNQQTLAQARLMEWLPTVGAMDWSAISRSHHSDIESAYGVTDGLLEFAALRMVDYKDDVLMHRCLIDFYSDLLHTTKSTNSGISTHSDSLATAVPHHSWLTCPDSGTVPTATRHTTRSCGVNVSIWACSKLHCYLRIRFPGPLPSQSNAETDQRSPHESICFAFSKVGSWRFSETRSTPCCKHAANVATSQSRRQRIMEC